VHIIIIRHLDTASVQFRQGRRLHRHEYFACGPNFIWHTDSHNKVKPFGICINGCIDRYSQKVMRLNCYYTSSDPRVISSHFVETVAKYKCIRGKLIWFGCKLWCLNTNTGYLMQYGPYQRANTTPTMLGLGMGGSVVVDLLSELDMSLKYHVYFDNLFT